VYPFFIILSNNRSTANRLFTISIIFMLSAHREFFVEHSEDGSFCVHPFKQGQARFSSRPALQRARQDARNRPSTKRLRDPRAPDTFYPLQLLRKRYRMRPDCVPAYLLAAHRIEGMRYLMADEKSYCAEIAAYRIIPAVERLLQDRRRECDCIVLRIVKRVYSRRARFPFCGV